MRPTNRPDVRPLRLPQPGRDTEALAAAIEAALLRGLEELLRKRASVGLDRGVHRP